PLGHDRSRRPAAGRALPASAGLPAHGARARELRLVAARAAAQARPAAGPSLRRAPEGRPVGPPRRRRHRRRARGPAAMRLRGDSLYAAGRRDELAFHFTSGDLARFDRWAAGERPHVRGSAVRWSRDAATDPSYASFRQFMTTVFRYAGSKSLADELEAV